ncbi:hypothetical protein Tco_1407786 [Tanacetum coccineum]
MELKKSSSFKTTGLLQPWQTLCKIFSKCLTTRVTGWDQPPLQIMQMIFTKIIISHYMTSFPEISRRARDMYHNLKDDDILKNIFNSGRYKDKVGMKIPDWMISEEMKHTEHYRMYAEVFGLDVPLTQSQPTESTQGMHRTLSALRRSTRLTPPAPVPTVDKADEMILQDTLQIEKMVEGSENVIDDSLLHRNDEPKIPGTRLEPMSDKESPKVEITNDKEVENTNDEEVEITNVVIPVNVNEEEEEITDDVYELKRKGEREDCSGARFMPRKSFDTLAVHSQMLMVRDQVPVYVAEGLILERQKTKEEMERMIAKAILQERGNIQAEISSQIQKAIDNHIPSQVDASVRSYMSGHILHVHPVQSQTPSVPEQQYQLYLSMKADPQLQQQDIAIWLALQMKFESLQVPQTTCRTSAVRPRDQDDPHDDAHPEGENRAKRQKTSEYEAYVSGESSSGQVNENEQGPSTSGNQEQEDDYDFWTESYASDDDEIPTKQMSQDIMEEVSLTIDEAKLKKMVDEMLRQRCTSGDEHQYHIDQMKNFLKSDIVWEKRKWVNKYVKKFNPYDRYDVEHWKNPHAKIFYIRKQKEPRKPKEIVARRANECIVSITELDYKNLNKNDIKDMYLLIMNGKVPDYAETRLLWSLSVFIRRLVIWERVHDFQLGIESYQQKVNLTAPIISFPGVEKHKMFTIIYEPMHGIIYKNSKKEKRVMRHSEIHKFCDATLNRVLEGLRSYNNDVKYRYIQRDLTNEEVEYLKLFEEEIEVRLKYRNQMRRWEMYVNGRPLGPRRERPE